MFPNMNDMPCPAPEELCALWEGELEGPRRSELISHREGCPSCGEEWRKLTRLSRLLSVHDDARSLSADRREEMKGILLEACKADLSRSRSPMRALRTAGLRWRAGRFLPRRASAVPVESPFSRTPASPSLHGWPQSHRNPRKLFPEKEKDMIQVQALRQPFRFRNWATGLAALAVLLGCGAGFWVAGQRLAAERNRLLPDEAAIRLTHSGPAEALAFSPGGTLMAVGEAAPIGKRSRITLWDPQAGVKQAEMEGHGEATEAVAFSPDGRLLATGGRDSKVRLWDAATGQPVHTLDTGADWTLSLAFSPDGRILAIGGGAGKTSRIALWETPTGTIKAVLKGHTGNVKALRFTQDGQRLLSGSWDRTVRVWDVNTGQFLKAFTDHPEPVNALALTSDGRTLAAAGIEGTILLWDVETGQVKGKLEGHTSTIHGIAFSSDDRFLVSAGNDSLIRMWDVVTGKVRQTLQSRHDPPSSLSFSPDGKTLAVGYYNLGKVNLWNWTEGR